MVQVDGHARPGGRTAAIPHMTLAFATMKERHSRADARVARRPDGGTRTGRRADAPRRRRRPPGVRPGRPTLEREVRLSGSAGVIIGVDRFRSTSSVSLCIGPGSRKMSPVESCRRTGRVRVSTFYAGPGDRASVVCHDGVRRGGDARTLPAPGPVVERHRTATFRECHDMMTFVNVLLHTSRTLWRPWGPDSPSPASRERSSQHRRTSCVG